MNDLNLMNITSIKASEVETLTRADGKTFVTRRFTFESEKHGTFAVTAFGDEALELSITFE